VFVAILPAAGPRWRNRLSRRRQNRRRATSAAWPASAQPRNTDTTNLNVTFDATHDAKTKDLWRFQGLYLRGETQGEVSVDRLFLQGRYERTITTRAFVFGETQYLRDEFKEIDTWWRRACVGYGSSRRTRCSRSTVAPA
jgi:hypothetical protein